jgi:hypothetical protein
MKVTVWLGCLVATLCLAASGCVIHKQHNLPPAQQLLEPGPGVGGPGPGVMSVSGPAIAAAAGACGPGYGGGGGAGPKVQVLFARPEGMNVRYDVSCSGAFDSEPLVVPARQNFVENGIYRLKLTNIPGPAREGVELYPTIEIGPTTPRTAAFLAHNAIPVQFTEEDFAQVLTGNFVTKVIYLPDPEFQELALAGVDTIVSTRLDPGVDPIVEADRRGSILGVIRLGNKDIELGGVNADAEAGYGFGYPGMYGPGYGPGCGPGGCGPGGCGPGGCGPGGYGNMPPTMPPPFVSGATVPQYGMPITGTPIGLPGPPHIPLGGQAGLQAHVMRNHTHYHIPEPNKRLTIDVKQTPGFSYPKPVRHVHIHEDMIHAALPNGQPHYDMHQR